MVDSPCQSICEMDSRTGYCRGCYRSLDEIANWTHYDALRKAQILSALPHRRQAGFSVFEASMVIVIVGLMIGIISLGHSLLLDGEYKRQMAQIQTIETAVTAFRERYQCFPGDCDTRTLITSVGNSDGFLPATWNGNENSYFWSNLIDSGLLEIRRVDHSDVGSIQTPRGIVDYTVTLNAVGSINNSQNILMMAGPAGKGAFSPDAAIFIDQKMDDDIAASGSVRSTGFGSTASPVFAANVVFPLAVTNNSGSTHCISSGVYDSSAERCNLIFIFGN